jgi:hypothetical protein
MSITLIALIALISLTAQTKPKNLGRDVEDAICGKCFINHPVGAYDSNL